MLRKFVRFLRLVDEILEVLVVRLVIGPIRRRPLRAAALLLSAVAGFSWATWQHPPVVPPCCAADPTGAMEDILDPDLESSNDLLTPDPVQFDVTAVAGDSTAKMLAVITYKNRRYTVSDGSLVPSAQSPDFVVTTVTPRGVEVYDWAARTSVRREMPVYGSAYAPLRFQVNAVAGRVPYLVALVELDGQTYIVQKDSRIPSTDAPRLRVLSVRENRVVAFDYRTNCVVSREFTGN